MQFKESVWAGEGISYRELCGRWSVLRYSKGPNRVAGVWKCHQGGEEKSETERVKQKLEYIKARPTLLFVSPHFFFSSLSFLGAFAKLWKATINFRVSVRRSVRLVQLGYKWIDFHENWYLNIFRKSVQKIQVSLKSHKNNGHFTLRPIQFFHHISSISSWN